MKLLKISASEFQVRALLHDYIVDTPDVPLTVAEYSAIWGTVRGDAVLYYFHARGEV